MRLTLIPFAGFYHSEHDTRLDYALESMFQSESGDPIWELVNRAHDLIDWRKAMISYATYYVKCFAAEYEIAGMTFESMSSPREYNFTTDLIFVQVPGNELVRIFNETPRQRLDQVAKAMFTSRSGFYSFYSPNVNDWGDIAVWDHNQTLALITAYVEDRGFTSETEDRLMESAYCNGRIENWIGDAGGDEMKRLWKVSDYLRQRKERDYA